MKYLSTLIILCAGVLFCSPESIQESLSGCEITEGSLACIDLKTSCTVGYSEWADPKAQDQIKCQCCEDKK